jgi:hypothetical protein
MRKELEKLDEIGFWWFCRFDGRCGRSFARAKRDLGLFSGCL